MVIGEQLKALREQKGLSQGDIEKRTGLLDVTSHGWRTGTLFPVWTRWRRWRAR